MLASRTHRYALGSPLHGKRKKNNLIMFSAGNAVGQTKKITLEDAGPSPPNQDGRIILYAHTLCPYAERAFLVLLEKEVPFHLVHIDLSSKPSWYCSINPRGLVPAVADAAGSIHIESLDICRWVADTDFAASSVTLSPSDAAGKARMNAIISAGSALSEAGISFLAGKNGRYWGIGSGQTAKQRAEFESALKKAIADPIKQSNGGPFLMGEQLTIADISVYPFVKRFQVACRAFCNGYDVYSVLDSVIGKWLDAMAQRSAVQITTADDILLLKAYRKHSSLDFFDYDTYSATELHPHNEVYRL